ncbi:MAG: peptide-methionine (S)-S-oxide reductase MsrA [Myxococcota bacterium]
MIGWMWFACVSEAAGPSLLPMATVPTPAPGQQVAVFAGGCFWCLESDFDHLPGVVATTSGYAGGTEPNPTYEQVSSHATHHLEAVHVVFDPAVVDYAKVLDYFWRHVDPTDAGGQFCDRGESYRTAIFPLDDAQRKAAEASKAALDATGKLPGPIVTPILPSQTFWPGEQYHQDFHRTNPGRYEPYRKGCGRDARTAEVWRNLPR